MINIKGDFINKDFNKNNKDNINENELNNAFKTLLINVKDKDLKTLTFIIYFTSFNILLIILILNIINTFINDFTFLFFIY